MNAMIERALGVEAHRRKSRLPGGRRLVEARSVDGQEHRTYVSELEGWKLVLEISWHRTLPDDERVMHTRATLVDHNGEIRAEEDL